MRAVALPGGAQVVVVPDPEAAVAAVQVWVGAGSADERDDEAGLAHLVEHMMFEGTARRGPGDAARELEAAGGALNAWTGRDCTTFAACVPARAVGLALDVLGDALLHSAIPDDRFASERRVVLAELDRAADDPRAVAELALWRAVYGDHAYGRAVLGDRDSVADATAARARAFWRRCYHPARFRIVVAGRVDPGAVVAATGAAFGAPRPPPHARRVRQSVGSACTGGRARAWPVPGAGHPDAAALHVLAAAMPRAGAPASVALYRYGGLLACSGDVARVVAEPLGDDVVRAAALEVALAHDRVVSRAEAIGGAWSHAGWPSAADELVARARALSARELHRVARRYLRGAAA